MRFALTLILSCTAVSSLVSQERRYVPETVDTVKGEVTAVQHHPARSGAGQGVHLLLKTADETIEVDLGPDWYIERQETQIEVGDKVAVTGSRIEVDGKPGMLALQVERGGDVLELRDERGVPRWAGWRGRWRDAVATGRPPTWWSPGSAYERLYDPEEVVSVSGVVESVGTFTPRQSAGRGLSLVLKDDDKGSLAVHLGPEWYLENQDLQIEAGDRITVRGSRVAFEGEPALIAATVEKGDDALELRDAQGFPRWAGWRRGRRAVPVGERGPRWWAAGSPYERHYDPKSVVTLTGKVETFHFFTPRDAVGRGLHLVLKTAQESLPVHLGPAWYLERQDLQLAVGDEVTVTGSRVDFEGKPAVIAATIQRGEQKMELRDEQGFPRWAAWRRR